MKIKLPIFMATILLLVSANAAIAQSFPTPSPTPDIPITLTSVKIRKQRMFPAEVEIQTSLGKFIGTGSLRYGPTVCTSIQPCLSGTLINSQYYLEAVSGTINGDNFHMSQGFWINYDSAWEIPYFHPYGRPIRKIQFSNVFPRTVYFNRAVSPWINYAAPINLTGTLKAEMAPLKRFQSPRPYTEFVSIEIDLAQDPPS